MKKILILVLVVLAACSPKTAQTAGNDMGEKINQTSIDTTSNAPNVSLKDQAKKYVRDSVRTKYFLAYGSVFGGILKAEEDGKARVIEEILKLPESRPGALKTELTSLFGQNASAVLEQVKKKTDMENVRELADKTIRELSVTAEPENITTAEKGGLRKATLAVRGYFCPVCHISVQQGVKEEPGVVTAKGYLKPPRLVVIYDTRETSLEKIKRSLVFQGIFSVTGVLSDHPTESMDDLGVEEE